jgi:hypothetical protein
VFRRALLGLLTLAVGCLLAVDPTAPFRPFVSLRYVGLGGIFPMLSFGLGVLLAGYGVKTLLDLTAGA